jgi:hypothetical protein
MIILLILTAIQPTEHYLYSFQRFAGGEFCFWDLSVVYQHLSSPLGCVYFTSVIFLLLLFLQRLSSTQKLWFISGILWWKLCKTSVSKTKQFFFWAILFFTVKLRLMSFKTDKLHLAEFQLAELHFAELQLTEFQLAERQN